MEIEDKFYPVKGYEDYYSINPITLEVYSNIKETILKGSIHRDKHGGYLGFCLKPNKDSKPIWKSLHRIIAETFIPNPNNYPVVNHINGNKLDNRIENLEWCTQQYNIKEAYRLGLIERSQKQQEAFYKYCRTEENIKKNNEKLKKVQPLATKKAKEINSIKVKLYEDDREIIFDSIRDLSKYINVSNNSISFALRKNRNYVKGYKIIKIN